MDALILEKTENIYLYLIKQNKEIELQKTELANLKAEVNELKTIIEVGKK